MGEVFFYQLTRSTLEGALAQLLPRALSRGWRIAVRGTDPARLDALDRALWEGEGFLPHGRAGGPHDALQPILLAEAPVPGADCLFAIDGAEVGAEEALGLARACLLFDGHVAASVAAARDQWRRLTAAGLPAQYWAEEGGAWTKKAQHPKDG